MAILALCCALLPVCVSAQGTDNEQESAIRGRIGAQVDKKIVRGLHVALDGELRTEDNFSDVGRWQAGVSVSYKFLPFLKASVGGDKVKVTFQLANEGGMPADEVVQLYVHRVDSSVEWPDKELKSFRRVSLLPGESKKVTL